MKIVHMSKDEYIVFPLFLECISYFDALGIMLSFLSCNCSDNSHRQIEIFDRELITNFCCLE